MSSLKPVEQLMSYLLPSCFFIPTFTNILSIDSFLHFSSFLGSGEGFQSDSFATCCMVYQPPCWTPAPVKPLRLPCPVLENHEIHMNEVEAEMNKYGK